MRIIGTFFGKSDSGSLSRKLLIISARARDGIVKHSNSAIWLLLKQRRHSKATAYMYSISPIFHEIPLIPKAKN